MTVLAWDKLSQEELLVKMPVIGRRHHNHVHSLGDLLDSAKFVNTDGSLHDESSFSKLPQTTISICATNCPMIEGYTCKPLGRIPPFGKPCLLQTRSREIGS